MGIGMTRLSLQRNSVMRWLVIGLLSWLAACGQKVGLEPKEQKMDAREMTLWEVIDQLGSKTPLRREKVETLFKASFSKMESSNQYFTFWEGDGGSLQNGVRLPRIVLGVRNEDEKDPGMLTLNLSGTCVTLDEIKKRYGELAVVGYPRGRSEDEETKYEAKAPWGKLVFGFAERNPECLSSVGLGPNKETGK